MFNAGVNEQLIKNFTGHKSDAVREYKRPSSEILDKANQAVVTQAPPSATVTKSEKPTCSEEKPSIAELTPLNHVKLENFSNSTAKCHPQRCLRGAQIGKCDGMCSILQQIDMMSAKRKAKNLKLSLKFRRT